LGRLKNDFERHKRWQEPDARWTIPGNSYLAPLKQTVTTFIRLQRHRIMGNGETFAIHTTVRKNMTYDVATIY